RGRELRDLEQAALRFGRELELAELRGGERDEVRELRLAVAQDRVLDRQVERAFALGELALGARERELGAEDAAQRKGDRLLHQGDLREVHAVDRDVDVALAANGHRALDLAAERLDVELHLHAADEEREDLEPRRRALDQDDGLLGTAVDLLLLLFL